MRKQTIKIKVDQTKLPNKMHFDVQRTTRVGIFRDRTKYSRKRKHKNKEDEQYVCIKKQIRQQCR